MSKWKIKGINLIIAFCGLIVLGIFIGASFDYYYDLNDDVLMKDILSGAYTGVAEGHNIQMLWPISAFISLFYKISPALPWYGMLLLGFQYGSVFIIIYRIIALFDQITAKLAIVAALDSLFGSLMLLHLINTQYTITVAMLAASALVWFATSAKTDTAAEFIKNNIPAILIATVAYLLRSEMLLLMLPYICVTGVLKWSFEKEIFSRKNLTGYLGVIGGIIAGMLLGQLIHICAYSSAEWKTFTDLFNARTQLYDYQIVPSYEGNESFYEGIGISQEEQILFKNYNYGIDSEINNETMWKVAGYAKEQNTQERPFFVKIASKLRLYIYEITHGPSTPGSDYPWNMVSLFLYIISGVIYILVKKYRGLLNLAFLFFVRTAIWLYILMGERSPDRITHSLYFIEICVLLSNLVMGYFLRTNEKRSSIICYFGAAVLFMMSLVIWPGQIKYAIYDQNIRNDLNKPYIELYEYMEENKDENFFVDVYSSVDYSEKIFSPLAQMSKVNSDIMGGWACFSPLQDKKLKNMGASDIESALLMDNAYYVRNPRFDMTWLIEYYASHDTEVSANKIKDIDGVFEIYEIRRQ